MALAAAAAACAPLGSKWAGGGGRRGLLLLFVLVVVRLEALGEAADDEVDDQAGEPGEEHVLAHFRRDPGGEEQQRGGRDRRGDRGDRADAGDRALDRRQPVPFLVGVEEEVQEHHQQEHAAEGRDRGVGRLEVLGVELLVVEGLVDHVRDRQPRGRRDDHDREHEPHPEDRDQDAPGQEDLLPARAHPLEDVRVDDRVVERDRDLEDREEQDDQPDLGAPQDERRDDRDDRHAEWDAECLEGWHVCEWAP